MVKARIPTAIREQVWIHHIGKKFQSQCIISWCRNRITVFDFHVSHDIPESKGGPTTLSNLKPLCARCNTSMGNQYTIDQWDKTIRVPLRVKLSSLFDVCSVFSRKKGLCRHEKIRQEVIV
jgi:5-methylcytosine-specific restriction endonuclease McrA